MERPAAVRRKRALDGEPGELVAEGHAVAVATNDAGLETGVQVLELLGHDRFQEPQLGAERHDRDRVEQPSRRLGEQRGPGEDGVPDRLRQLAASRRQDLGHVERVPPRQPVDRLGVRAGRLRELTHGVERERRHREADTPLAVASSPEDDPQRMVARHLVVAVGREHERTRPLDPAAEDAEDVERGRVGPVDVLQHDHSVEVERRRGNGSGSPGSRPMSRNGPSGAGAARFSHEPRRTPPAESTNARTRAVLPTPASPPTKSRPPPPARADSRRASRSSRSSSTAMHESCVVDLRLSTASRVDFAAMPRRRLHLSPADGPCDRGCVRRPPREPRRLARLPGRRACGRGASIGSPRCRTRTRRRSPS